MSAPAQALNPEVSMCCGNCAFGEPQPVGSDLKRRIKCRNGTATAILMPAPGPAGQMGVNLQFMRPLWLEDEWCFMFSPREDLLRAQPSAPVPMGVTRR